MYVEYQGSTFMDDSYDDNTCTDIKQRGSMEMLNLRAYVSKIRELVILSLSHTHTHTELLGFLIWCLLFNTFFKFFAIWLFLCIDYV